MITACAIEDGGPDTQSANVMEQGNETCTATLQILQKDAYKETAGRSSVLWPPHTTNVLTVTCQSPAQQGEPAVVADVAMVNHGTAPGAVDANGDVILVEARIDTIEGDRDELLRLAENFEACDCEGDSQFLSTSSLEDEKIQELIASLSGYLEDNLTCPSGVASLTSALNEGRVAEALVLLDTCTWNDGSDMATGLDKAAQEALVQSDETLQDYHLCNNDAILQVELFETFAQTGTLNACDATSALCHSPTWFYDPNAVAADAANAND